MNEIQKELVSSLHSTGLGYKAIAGRLGISRDTVRSYLRYHKDEFTTAAAPCGSEEAPTLCFYCGAPLKHMDHRKQKHFCSDTCRVRYWTLHITEKSKYKGLCLNCGRPFGSTHKGRLFCSRQCYFLYRFHGGINEI